ncbi:MAG: ABC transporter permease [Sphaerochaetaceae bacterium]
MNQNVSQRKTFTHHAVLILLLFLVSMVLPFLQVRENRIAEELTIGIFALGIPSFILLLVPPMILVLSVFVSQNNRANWLLSIAGVLGLLVPMLVLASIGEKKIANLGAFARYSPASGMYLYMTANAIMYLMKPKVQKQDKVFLFLVVLCMAFLGSIGRYDHLGILLEAKNLGPRLNQEIVAHIRITGISLGISIGIGIPLALLSFQNRRIRAMVFPVLNILQTIPGIALFGLLIAPLAALSKAFPLLREWGIQGIGNTPAIIALSIYALYPIIRYTYTSLAGIDEQVILAASGMGMNSRQLWWIVRLPLATVGILHGIRVALVQTIGNATLAKLIGGDGLGVLVFEGLGQESVDMVLLGMLLIIALTVVTDRLFQILIILMTPKPLRREAY